MLPESYHHAKEGSPQNGRRLGISADTIIALGDLDKY
jgi:hypothetical protein